MKINKIFIGSFVAILGLILVEFYIYINYSKLSNKDIHISFVVSGENLDYFESMKSGADNAALDNNCIVNFSNSPYSMGVEGEIDLINRQFSDGADYVFVDSGYYEDLVTFIDDNKLEDRVFFIKSGSATDSSKGVFADDYRMGCDYARLIIEENEAHRLIAIYHMDNINNKNFLEGLQDGLASSDTSIAVRQVKGTDEQVRQSIYNYKQSGLYDGIVAIDSTTVECVVHVMSNTSKELPVYCVDDRQEAVYYLDSGVTQALALKDDYSLGFIAVKAILREDVNLEDIPLYYIVTKEDIYSERYEKVLFPFAK